MTTVIEKKNQIIKNITDYLDKNQVNTESHLFKGEYFLMLKFEKEEVSEESVMYVFTKMDENSTNEQIARAMVDRFLIEGKQLGFKNEHLSTKSEKYHKPLLIEALAAYSLSRDILEMEGRIPFKIEEIKDMFEGEIGEQLLKEDALLEKGFRAVFLGSVKLNKKINLPTSFAIIEKIKEKEGENLIKAELGEESQRKISENLPKLKEQYKISKNKLK